MLLSIIIVSYNTSELTQQTIVSVWDEVKASKLLHGKTEVIVVDNNSKDSSVSNLRNLFKKIPETELKTLLIQNPNNEGFSAANNVGIDQSHGKYLLLLNSDTIVQPGGIVKMVEAFENHQLHDLTATVASHSGELDRLGVLSAQLLNKDMTPQAQGGSLPSLFSLASHMLMLDDLPIIGKFLPSTQHTGLRSDTFDVTGDSQIREVIQQEWVGGTAMMIRREVINEVGKLDQNIFMYGEDIEFCWRALHHQWDIGLCPAAKIVHLGSASSSSANALKGEFKGYLYIWSKHQPLWQLFWARLLLKTGAHLRKFLFGTIMRQKSRAKVYTTILSEVF